MALGRKSGAVTEKTNHDVAVDNSYHPDLLKGPEYDPESTREGNRKMSRVGGPIRLADSDAESAVSVRKQLELEAENQIKYRTCSWQKVHQTFLLIPNHRAEYVNSYVDISISPPCHVFSDLLRVPDGRGEDRV